MLMYLSSGLIAAGLVRFVVFGEFEGILWFSGGAIVWLIQLLIKRG